LVGGDGVSTLKNGSYFGRFMVGCDSVTFSELGLSVRLDHYEYILLAGVEIGDD
jgi:hypothetical protein